MDADLLGDSGSGSSGCATALGSSSVAIGIVIAVTASVGINVGQNLQAVGLQSLPDAAVNPCSSRTWVVGLVIFITGSLLNFAAFSFAAASIVVPIEAVQFVTNVRPESVAPSSPAHRVHTSRDGRMPAASRSCSPSSSTRWP